MLKVIAIPQGPELVFCNDRQIWVIHPEVHPHHLLQHVPRRQIEAAFSMEIFVVSGVQSWNMHRAAEMRWSPPEHGAISVHIRSRQHLGWTKRILLAVRWVPRTKVILELGQSGRKSVSSEGEDVIQVSEMAEIAAG